jgi:hypothetical protein
MDLTKVLAQLHAELANLDAAILSLERLQQEGPRRGRPPKSPLGLKRVGRPRKSKPALEEEKGE